MSKPAVSILVPICNTEHYLRDCLNTLVSQTLADIEIICIDDGSTDSSPQIIEDFMGKDSRIKVITKPNSGYGDSMNRGLQEATGEYVGIVESDDFVEMDMFEELYALAKACDADVVKSNFFYHNSQKDPHNDPLVDNLVHCVIGRPFNPLDHQDVFLTQPAIWSAIYKKELLEENEIKFLPTPGASFQDTGFNFKVFAAAKTAFLSDKAYLHYRIDNAGSSVKSQEKIFCVCEEYDEIWRFAKLDEARYDALKFRIPQIQFGGYQWNLDRLIESLRYQFYEKFVADFSALKSDDLLREEYFDSIAWDKLSCMLDDPEAYFVAIYGPIKVDTTHIVRIEDAPVAEAQAFLDKLLDEIPPNDEVVVYAVNATDAIGDVVAKYISSYGRIFGSNNLFVSRAFEVVDNERLRGREVKLHYLTGSKSLKAQKGDDQGSAGAPPLATFETQALASLDIPVCVPLLPYEFYSAALVGDGPSALPTFEFERIQRGAVTLDEYQGGKEAYQALASCAHGILSKGTDPSTGVALLRSVAPYWETLKCAYAHLSYDERIRSGSRPSSTTFPFVTVSDNELWAEASPDVSVIVPVYNVEKYLTTCLESILSQDVSLEVICVDDGSSDGSLDILRTVAKDDRRVKVISQLNGGAGAARNRAIDLAAGNYLAFIDPDDFYPYSSALSDLVDAAKKNAALVCGGSLETIDAQGREGTLTKASNCLYRFGGEGSCEFSKYENDYGWIRFVYDRLIFQDEAVRFPETYRYEDPVFLLRVASKVKEFHQIPQVVYCYRIEHKETSWSAPQVRDLLAGIKESMDFAERNSWFGLYSELVRRLDCDYYDAIYDCMYDEEVVARMSDFQANLRFDKINFVHEKGWSFILLNAFKEKPDLALTRLAKKVESTSLYEGLQSLRRKARSLRALSNR